MKRALAMILAVVMMATMGTVPAFARGTESVISITFTLDSGAKLPEETKADGKQGVSITVYNQDGTMTELPTLVLDSVNPSLEDLLFLFEAGYEYSNEYQIKVEGSEVEITTNSNILEKDIARVEFYYRSDIFNTSIGDSVKLATGNLEVKNQYGTRSEVSIGETFYCTDGTDSPMAFVFNVEDHNATSDYSLTGVVSNTKVYYVLQNEMYSDNDFFKIGIERAQGAGLVQSIRKVVIDFGEQAAFVVGEGNIDAPKPAFMLGKVPRTAYEVTLKRDHSDSNTKISFNFTVEATAKAIDQYTITGNTSQRLEQTGAIICTGDGDGEWDGDNSTGTGTPGTGSGDPAQPTPPDTGTVQTPATVDKNGNATTTVPEQTVTDAIRSAKAAGQSGRTSGIAVLLDVTGGKGASSIATTLSQASLDALITAGVTEVTVQSDVATITLDLATLKAIRATADGDVVISAQPVKPGTLPAGGRAAIGSRPVFNFSITAGGKPVTGFGGGTVSLAIPYTPAAGENTAGLYGVYVSETGNTIYLTNSAYDASAKLLRMSATHFSVFGVGYKAPATFADTKTHFAKADIEFVAARGLLTGTAGSFSPNAPLTRATFVTALGQLTGVNGSSYKTTPFTDVPATASYAPYAAWAVEKGILTGADANTFAPEKPITRQELAVSLQNYAKAVGYPLPKTREAIAFADSTAIAPTARDAVKALQMAGVMNGKNDNKFDPAAPATRGELASILHRFIELRMDPKTAQGFDVNDSGTTLLYENGRLVKSTERVVGASTYTFNQYGEAALA